MNNGEQQEAGVRRTSRYKQSAEGHFSCEVVVGTPHCGIDEHRGEFKYIVEIGYSDRRALDDNGFLLDNTTFRDYFKNLDRLVRSCELVAEEACEHFMELLGPRAQYVTSLSVRIFPFDGVSVEASTVAG